MTFLEAPLLLRRCCVELFVLIPFCSPPTKIAKCYKFWEFGHREGQEPAGNLGSTLPGPCPQLPCEVFFAIDSSSLLELSGADATPPPVALHPKNLLRLFLTSESFFPFLFLRLFLKPLRKDTVKEARKGNS